MTMPTYEAFNISCSKENSDHHQTSMSLPTTTTTTTTSTTTETTFADFYCLCSSRDSRQCDTMKFCDKVLTYKDPDNALDVPHSSWTSARNAMYFLSREKKRTLQRQGQPVPSHSCFMDGDARLNPGQGGKQHILELLLNETEHNKVVAFNYRKAYDGVKYLYYADANLHCFSHVTIDRFFPLSTLMDHRAWSLAPIEMAMRFNMQEPLMFKIYEEMIIRNPEHSAYPRNISDGVEELRAYYASLGYSSDCIPTNCRHLQTYSCSYNGTELFSIPFNRTHACGYWGH